MSSDSFGLLPYLQDAYEPGDPKGAGDYLGDLEDELEARE